MNITVNIRNKTKLVEKLRWYTYKITCLSTTNYLHYKRWHQVKIETLHFDQND